MPTVVHAEKIEDQSCCDCFGGSKQEPGVRKGNIRASVTYTPYQKGPTMEYKIEGPASLIAPKLPPMAIGGTALEKPRGFMKRIKSA